jgi:hypothetical protein
MTREEAEDLSEEDKGEEEKTAEGAVSPWPRLAFTREKRNKRNWVGRIDVKRLSSLTSNLTPMRWDRRTFI